MTSVRVSFSAMGYLRDFFFFQNNPILLTILLITKVSKQFRKLASKAP